MMAVDFVIGLVALTALVLPGGIAARAVGVPRPVLAGFAGGVVGFVAVVLALDALGVRLDFRPHYPTSKRSERRAGSIPRVLMENAIGRVVPENNFLTAGDGLGLSKSPRRFRSAGSCVAEWF
ncbi:MAG: hypothetical protein EXS37_00780 [Opitutus sp.]|nr:hypothetical protein [Opitutus sp.]